uniref:Putative N-acetyltransferase 8 (Putative) n=1 Tax=Pipistrellus kuhlii TaxID=59472 RepID=A0A7J7V0Q7_PIPKU|nr:putative N-acetyltransferase 8 (putative) [Pipistrellus kuhlii]
MQKKQLHLVHLTIALEHRRWGIAKALVRTVLQFAGCQGYREVVLVTSMMQDAALALYQHLGFWTTRKYYHSKIWAVIAVPEFQLTYWLPSDQSCPAPAQRGCL